MRGFFFRAGFLVLPLVLAAWAGCSSSDATPEPGDAGADTAAAILPPAPPPPPPPPADAAVRDCTADLGADGVPGHLDCTGLYADPATKAVAPDAKPYRPGVEFWSDGAEKSRYLYLPPGAKIDTSSFSEWKFPAGTKAWKEFKVDGKLVETRLFWKIDATAWKHVVYRWNAAETEAVRLEAGESIPRAGNPPYEVPANSVCVTCHSGHDEQLLGVEAVSLGHPNAQGLTLAQLAADGRLSTTPPTTQLVIPDDGTGKIADALGWLHINCGPCHTSNPNGAAFYTMMHLQVHADQLVVDGGADASALDVYKTAVCKDSTRLNPDAGPGVNYKRIEGTSPSTSIVSILSGSRVPDGGAPTPDVQMPPILSHLVDTNGHAKLDAWISALPVCP